MTIPQWNLSRSIREKTMGNIPTQEISPETRELFEHIEKALIKAGQEARALADRTNTPLVICQPKPAAKTAISEQE